MASISSSYPQIIVKSEVRVRVSIKRIIEIDIPGQTFTADFFLEALWMSREAGLCANGAKVNQDKSNKNQGNRRHLYLECPKKYEENKYFHPHVYLTNLVKYSESDKEEWYVVCIHLMKSGSSLSQASYSIGLWN